MAKRGTGGGTGRSTSTPRKADTGPVLAPHKNLPDRQTKISEGPLRRPRR